MQCFFRVVRVFPGLFPRALLRVALFGVFGVFCGFPPHAVLFLCVLCVLWFSLLTCSAARSGFVVFLKKVYFFA
ncbi:MAG: hypothetical protein J6V91_01120, partial [Kiritimatiellae bacterium]|nr:hypothetical protein [Kiritimatiellia bacterium]